MECWRTGCLWLVATGTAVLHGRGCSEWYLQHVHACMIVCLGALHWGQQGSVGEWLFRGMRALVQPPLSVVIQCSVLRLE
jgi:hypothetical protein